VSTVPIRIVNDSVVIRGLVDNEATVFVLDTGDAIGPVFNQADAFRLGLEEGTEEGVSGAGGASNVYQTTASITFDDMHFPFETCAIDTSLQGQSLMGLPFFLRTCSKMEFDFDARKLTLTSKPTPLPKSQPLPGAQENFQPAHAAEPPELAEPTA
jgi:hypothetical protein